MGPRIVTGGPFSLLEAMYVPEAAFWTDNDTWVTSLRAGAFATGCFFLALDAVVHAIKNPFLSQITGQSGERRVTYLGNGTGNPVAT